MIKSIKQLTIVLVLICISTTALGLEEPAFQAAPLKIETNNGLLTYKLDPNQKSQTFIKPTHVAILCINLGRTNLSYWFKNDGKSILLSILDGKLFSPQQINFLRNTTHWYDLEEITEDFYNISLYAISENDAVAMAKALVEILTREGEKNIRKGKDYIKYDIHLRKNEIEKAKIKILELQSSKDAEISVCQNISDTNYVSIEESEKQISEYNRIINNLDIEEAAIIAKLKTINIQTATIRSRKETEKNIALNEILPKLEEKRIDLIIELSAIETKRDVAKQILNKARNFMKLMNSKKEEVEKEIHKLQAQINIFNSEIMGFEYQLNSPAQELIPRVFQNRASTYMVDVKE
jgi:hypothetical protein